jgi:hypothetical protein
MDKNPGMSMEDAIRETARHIPDYRVPARVLNSTTISQIMTNSNITMFGRYHYGALKSYVEMAKEVASGKNTLQGFDHILMLGLVTTVVYPALDKLTQVLTGNPNATIRRAGAVTFINNTVKLYNGDMDVYQYLTSVATPAAGNILIAKVLTQHDPDTGRLLIRMDHVKEDVTKLVMSSIAPVDLATKLQTGKKSGKETVAGLLGVSMPKHVYKTPAEKLAAGYVKEMMEGMWSDADTEEHRQLRNTFKSDIAKGDTKALNDALKAGDITDKDTEEIQASWTMPTLERLTKSLRPGQVLTVYGKASPEEREGLLETLSTKVHAYLDSESNTQKEKDEILAKLRGSGYPEIQQLAGKPK